jgi:hypothetical protein
LANTVNHSKYILDPEPEFFNFLGAQESIPRNQFCQLM